MSALTSVADSAYRSAQLSYQLDIATPWSHEGGGISGPAENEHAGVALSDEFGEELDVLDVTSMPLRISSASWPSSCGRET
jgi:hypothetical protein